MKVGKHTTTLNLKGSTRKLRYIMMIKRCLSDDDSKGFLEEC